MILEDRAASHQVSGHAHSVRQGHREKAEGLHILIFIQEIKAECQIPRVDMS